MFAWFYRDQFRAFRQELAETSLRLDYESMVKLQAAKEIEMLERWAQER